MVLTSPHQCPENERYKWYPRIAQIMRQAIEDPCIQWCRNPKELGKRFGSQLHG